MGRHAAHPDDFGLIMTLNTVFASGLTAFQPGPSSPALLHNLTTVGVSTPCVQPCSECSKAEPQLEEVSA